MEGNKMIKEDNYKVFALLSNYLNHAPDFIDEEEIDDLIQTGVSHEYAFGVILAAAFGLDIVDKADEKEFFYNYFNKMIHKLDANDYYNNPYYKNIKIPAINIGNSELKYEKYKPFEGFVCNDIIQTKAGRQIPQIGFFDAEFKFPAILENDRIWMTITPNEIETMREPVDKAFGSVLTFGLGLGYYVYMVSEKDNVEGITVVESNEDVIDLFKKYILPQFKNAHKIKIIKADAFEYAQKHMAKGKYDFAFTDLWHDVSDGIDMYLKMKTYEKRSPDTVFTYWIEKSILCYL
ncbi:hypothetical protein CIL03_00520 [Virgibacillus indicus]|uniref:Spermidine synthase n=2 Tax=Virgibacillus indicus TaxID=2024554 RepID=A0A265NF22_9BACI|nr:hypothetical protein CIL03_00520 [Virgibacillus indicus]